jgi:hypothetical protein
MRAHIRHASRTRVRGGELREFPGTLIFAIAVNDGEQKRVAPPLSTQIAAGC